MPPLNDLVGRRFGRLTVLERDGTTSPVKWKCLCDCGNKVSRRARSLVEKQTTSCGCLLREIKKTTGQKHLQIENGTNIAAISTTAAQENSKTGVRGIWPIAQTKSGAERFRAAIHINGVTHDLGVFYSMGEAEKAYNHAKETHHIPVLESRGRHLYKHGGTGTRLYSIWKHIRQRCTNPHDRNYPRYGGRGITICDEWSLGFPAFRDWAMANGYRDDLTLDREDNDKGYCPDNCRWATRQTQSENRRNSNLLTADGETRTVAEWSRLTGIHPETIRSRVNRLGWPHDRAIKEGAKA